MGKKQHLSRLASPRTWPVSRKKTKWIAKSIPGAHNLKLSMPILIVLRDILKLAKTSLEVKRIVNAGDIVINGNICKSPKLPVGLLDVISIPKISKNYRIVLNEVNKFSFIEINNKESKLVPLKISNKTIVKGGKTQLNFTNGWNLISNKKSYSTGDVILFDVSKKKEIEHLKLSKGSTVYIIRGRHVGTVATFYSVSQSGRLKKTNIATLVSGKNKFETLVDNLFVIGKQKESIKVK